jgi:hypothetical protein
MLGVERSDVQRAGHADSLLSADGQFDALRPERRREFAGVVVEVADPGVAAVVSREVPGTRTVGTRTVGSGVRRAGDADRQTPRRVRVGSPVGARSECPEH